MAAAKGRRASAQSFFRLFALRDVEHESSKLDRDPILALDADEVVQPNDRTGGRDHAVFELVLAGRQGGCLAELESPRPVLFVDVSGPERFLIPTRQWVSEDLHGLGTHVSETRGFGIRLPGNDVGRLDEPPQTVLALGQCYLGALAGGDIVHHHADAAYRSVLADQWAEASQPVAFHAGVCGSRHLEVDINQRCGRLQDPAQQGLQSRRQRRQELHHGATDMVQHRPAVNLGQTLVDPQVAQIAAQQTEAHRNGVVYVLELQYFVPERFVLGEAHGYVHMRPFILD